MDSLALIKFVQKHTDDVNEQARILAAYGPPPEETELKQKLPVQNEIPSLSLRQNSVGGDVAGLDYGVPAPMFGQKGNESVSLGQLLTGEIDG
jgi:hypothetical protein